MGLAHIYNRAFQATRLSHFANAARMWAEHALATQRKPGTGIAGFASHSFTPRPTDIILQDDTGFLTGAAGVGLALLSLLTSAAPRWDGVLLTEIPLVDLALLRR